MDGAGAWPLMLPPRRAAAEVRCSPGCSSADADSGWGAGSRLARALSSAADKRIAGARPGCATGQSSAARAGAAESVLADIGAALAGPVARRAIRLPRETAAIGCAVMTTDAMGIVSAGIAAGTKLAHVRTTTHRAEGCALAIPVAATFCLSCGGVDASGWQAHGFRPIPLAGRPGAALTVRAAALRRLDRAAHAPAGRFSSRAAAAALLGEAGLTGRTDRPLVDETITVIVEPVARFRGRLLGPLTDHRRPVADQGSGGADAGLTGVARGAELDARSPTGFESALADATLLGVADLV